MCISFVLIAEWRAEAGVPRHHPRARVLDRLPGRARSAGVLSATAAVEVEVSDWSRTSL